MRILINCTLNYSYFDSLSPVDSVIRGAPTQNFLAIIFSVDLSSGSKQESRKVHGHQQGPDERGCSMIARCGRLNELEAVHPRGGLVFVDIHQPGQVRPPHRQDGCDAVEVLVRELAVVPMLRKRSIPYLDNGIGLLTLLIVVLTGTRPRSVAEFSPKMVGQQEVVLSLLGVEISAESGPVRAVIEVSNKLADCQTRGDELLHTYGIDAGPMPSFARSELSAAIASKQPSLEVLANFRTNLAGCLCRVLGKVESLDMSDHVFNALFVERHGAIALRRGGVATEEPDIG